MYTFRAGSVISSAEMNSNFSEIANHCRELDARRRSWTTIQLASGWSNVGKRPLSVKYVGGVVHLQGIVRRGAGASLLNIGNIGSTSLVPTISSIVGAVNSTKYQGALSIGNDGTISVMPYGNWGSDANWDIPISVSYAI